MENPNWEGLKKATIELSVLQTQVGYLRQQMPGEAQYCVKNAYLKLREASMWLDQAVDEENIQ